MEREKKPMLTHPDVKRREQEVEMSEGLEAERIFFEYKFLEEEMMALTDGITKYFTYERVMATKFYDSLPTDLKDKIAGHAIFMKPGKKLREKKQQPLLVTDLEALQEFGMPETEGMEEDEAKWDAEARQCEFKIFFNDVILHAKKDQSDKQKGDESLASLEASSKALSGTVALDLKERNKIRKVLDSYDEEELEKIASFKSAIRPEIELALSREKFLSENIDSAKESRSTEHLREAQTVSQMRGLEVEEILKERKLEIKALDEKKQPMPFRKYYRKFKELRLQLKEVTDESEKETLKSQIKEVKDLAERALDIVVSEGTVEQVHDELGNIVNREAIPSYVRYVRELNRLKILLEGGEIVETDYIKGLINRAMESLKKKPGEKPQIVYFHGDFGTGKTALANQICKTRFDKNPIIVAGSKFLEPERFTEEFRLSQLTEIDHLNRLLASLGKDQLPVGTSNLDIILERVFTKDEIRKEIGESYDEENMKLLKARYEKYSGKSADDESSEFNEYVKENRKKTGDVMSEAKEDINDDIDALFVNKVQGRYVLGAMYEAMRTGTPLIIDEANAISPDVLIAFNDLLTKKIGDRIQSRSDVGEFSIKPGYCIIFTGNSGERFKQARFNDIDPAFYSRILPIKVEYLPQQAKSADSGLDDLLDRFNLDSLAERTFSDETEMLEEVKDIRKKSKQDQIFQVLMIKLMNSRIGAKLLRDGDRYKTVKDVYRLSVAARMLMDLFEQKTDGFPFIPALDKLINTSVGGAVAKELKKSNLSMRELIDNIIGNYLADGCNMDIEWYVFKFIKSRDLTPKEQVIIVAMFEQAGFLKLNEGWGILKDESKPESSTNQRESLLDKAANPEELSSILNNFKVLDQVDKYKKIEHNGDTISLLNVKDHNYSFTYLNSLETLQTIFGYLPAVKPEQYEGVSKKIKARELERKGDSGEIEREEKLLSAVRDITENFTLTKTIEFDSFADRLQFISDVEVVFYQMRDLVRANVTGNYDEILELCNIINGKYIDMFEKDRANKNSLGLSQEELDRIKSLDPAAQASAINKVIKKIKP